MDYQAQTWRLVSQCALDHFLLYWGTIQARLLYERRIGYKALEADLSYNSERLILAMNQLALENPQVYSREVRLTNQNTSKSSSKDQVSPIFNTDDDETIVIRLPHLEGERCGGRQKYVSHSCGAD